jgi:hypothetical protein
LQPHRRPSTWLAWLRREALRARVERAFFLADDAADQERLSHLLTLLEMMPAVSTALASR